LRIKTIYFFEFVTERREFAMGDNSVYAAQTSAQWAPEMGASYRHGIDRLKTYFLELLLITLINGALFIPFIGSKSPLGGLLGIAYIILLYEPIRYGVAYAFLKAARTDHVEVKDMFACFQHYGNTVLAAFLVDFLVFLGFIFFIVPGFILICKFAFVPYLVMDRKMDAIEAVKRSWQMTSGYAFEIFLIGLVGIAIGFAGLLCFGVGIIVAMMWIRLAFASMYYTVSVSASDQFS
jgi:uncharacterized membrane protein